MREVNVSLRTKVQGVPSFLFVVRRLHGFISRLESRVREFVFYVAGPRKCPLGGMG